MSDTKKQIARVALIGGFALAGALIVGVAAIPFLLSTGAVAGAALIADGAIAGGYAASRLANAAIGGENKTIGQQMAKGTIVAFGIAAGTLTLPIMDNAGLLSPDSTFTILLAAPAVLSGIASGKAAAIAVKNLG